ncbi:non-SMC mitotic condensation complex subunit 1 domain-containing protein [Rozella allomycis CSF55]|uniref:Non-SMC mitotic condensation complex subunit 1 domain-containing protein n=1 Tax=Rozella allomycis (strain CSF55) TaxID=988480 RepID=A0A075AN45_ROZAC|nr:non-SMC mitotic condensation complex subunit 1 domain-containing protein [Rozella allomycis CSF55]|eukprot:EPZ31215.1 non-SMC mitotic condensation complex subunit 1 domain-containing protein [Rozella allomycis CSF55]
MIENRKVFNLTRLLFVVGHVAIKQLVHLELLEHHCKSKSSKNANKSLDDIENVTGNVDDDLNDLISLVKEKELLFGKNSLLSIYGPLVAQVCANNKVYNDLTLQIVANVTLCKFMCVSSEYCQSHLQLLLTILSKSNNSIIKSNIVIAIGDMAICFNHLIDQNIHFLYNKLSDNHLSVKKNTFMVLTHLILNGMIKVKGQLAEMAKCLSSNISDLAKLFFTELSSKDNAIYNNLPDIISNLSSSNTSDPDFFYIMKFIFSFIKKEKQYDSIIDKLCLRFKNNSNQSNWRHIGFCLSLLSFNEKSLKKLFNHLPLYQDKLHDEKLFKYLIDIVAKSKKISFADEFEKKLILLHSDAIQKMQIVDKLDSMDLGSGGDGSGSDERGCSGNRRGGDERGCSGNTRGGDSSGGDGIVGSGSASDKNAYVNDDKNANDDGNILSENENNDILMEIDNCNQPSSQSNVPVLTKEQEMEIDKLLVDSEDDNENHNPVIQSKHTIILTQKKQQNLEPKRKL